MKRRTKQQWFELFKLQASGDLSIAAFCKEHSIGQSYFYKRKSELTGKKDGPLSTQFIKIKQQVNSITPVCLLELHYQQTRLTLPTSISPHWLADFVKALA
jgi:hypothetical protein